MDQIDTLYPQLDAETLLHQHGLALAAEARGILQTAANAKVVGLILTPDTRDAEPFTQAIAAATARLCRRG